MSLAGKRILVTGATGKLGRVLVRRLIDDGAWVAVTYRSNESLAGLLACLDPDGPQPQAYECELSDPDSVEALAQGLAQTADLPLQGLALLAGGWAGGTPLWESAGSDLPEVMHANVLPTWNVLRRFVGGMVDAGYGRIVTVGARHSVTPVKGNAAYAAAKGAVASMTTTIAEDLRGTGVSAACILPRLMRAEASGNAVSYDAVAAMIAWLLDEDAAIVDGALLPVYGSS